MWTYIPNLKSARWYKLVKSDSYVKVLKLNSNLAMNGSPINKDIVVLYDHDGISELVFYDSSDYIKECGVLVGRYPILVNDLGKSPEELTLAINSIDTVDELLSEVPKEESLPQESISEIKNEMEDEINDLLHMNMIIEG